MGNRPFPPAASTAILGACALISMLALMLVSLPALAQDPLGAQFQVNTLVPDPFPGASINYGGPRIEVTADGGFVVVWSGGVPDPEDAAVFGRRFGPDAIPLGDQFQVNSGGRARRPALGIAPDASFVAVWESRPDPGKFDSEVMALRYASDGTPLGSEFTVNSDSEDGQLMPDVGIDASGDFVVSWFDSLFGTNGRVAGRRFEADATPVDDGFEVDTDSYNLFPRLSVAPEGDFVVVWERLYSVYARRHAADAVPVGASFQVDMEPDALYKGRPDVAERPGGGFVVVWEDSDFSGVPYAGGIDHQVRARLYDGDGEPLGPDFVAHSSEIIDQRVPAVASDSEYFVVVWEDDETTIRGRAFAAGGQPLAETFQVNTVVAGTNRFPGVAITPDGDFVVAWLRSAGGEFSIQGQRLSDPVGRLFGDGFESGDASAWSSSTEPATSVQIPPVTSAARF